MVAPPPGRMPSIEPSTVPRSTAGAMLRKSSRVGIRLLTSAENTSRSLSCLPRLLMISP